MCCNGVLAVDHLHDGRGVDEDAVLDRLSARHFIGRAAGQALGGGSFCARAPPASRTVPAAAPGPRFFFGDGPLDQRLGRGDVGGLISGSNSSG